ncbi:EthD family reductase [Neptunicella sp. SCSIO 80796]|uniref:EthD family reductase n=1 Tax=Neptunicella plasticusilytica TaxID=3117012 RepID=UPI003A4D35D3
MSDVKLMVLYPKPADPKQFDHDYRQHIELLHKKMDIPMDARPYTITQVLQDEQGNTPFYKIFSMPFESADILQQTMVTTEMQEVAADAVRISTGGAPVILVGSDML